MWLIWEGPEYLFQEWRDFWNDKEGIFRNEGQEQSAVNFHLFNCSTKIQKVQKVQVTFSGNGAVFQMNEFRAEIGTSPSTDWLGQIYTWSLAVAQTRSVRRTPMPSAAPSGRTPKPVPLQIRWHERHRGWGRRDPPAHDRRRRGGGQWRSSVVGSGGERRATDDNDHGDGLANLVTSFSDATGHDPIDRSNWGRGGGGSGGGGARARGGTLP